MTEEQTQQAQNITTFSHDVAFTLLTHVDVDSLEIFFEGYLKNMEGKVAEGYKPDASEELFIDVCKAGDFEVATSLLIKVTFTEYLQKFLEDTTQKSVSDTQKTEFKAISVTSK